MLARQEIAQKSIDALSDDMREHRQTLEKLDLQHKALSLQLQMLQRMGAQMEAATEAAMRDAQSQRVVMLARRQARQRALALQQVQRRTRSRRICK